MYAVEEVTAYRKHSCLDPLQMASVAADVRDNDPPLHAPAAPTVMVVGRSHKYVTNGKRKLLNSYVCHWLELILLPGYVVVSIREILVTLTVCQTRSNYSARSTWIFIHSLYVRICVRFLHSWHLKCLTVTPILTKNESVEWQLAGSPEAA